MVRERRNLAMVLASMLAAYLLTLAAMLRWHWEQGPPHTQATFSLMVAFGLCAALVGLSSVSVALAALHWTRRASGLLAGLAVLGLFWTRHFDWNGFLIWQMLVMFGVQTVVLVVILGIASFLGTSLVRLDQEGRGGSSPGTTRALQFSISDFVIFIVALALLFAVMRGSRPIDLGATVYLLNVAGGSCAAFVSLTVLWACLGTAPVIPRATALVLVAPIGGAVFVLAARHAVLLFNWRWYSGVTTALVLFMAIPCLILRARGFRFASGG
jgi:hypothetical protein